MHKERKKIFENGASREKCSPNYSDSVPYEMTERLHQSKSSASVLVHVVLCFHSTQYKLTPTFSAASHQRGAFAVNHPSHNQELMPDIVSTCQSPASVTHCQFLLSAANHISTSSRSVSVSGGPLKRSAERKKPGLHGQEFGGKKIK